MFAPGVRQPSYAPRGAFPFILGALAISSTLIGWAFLGASSLTNESAATLAPAISPESVRSVAYVVPGRSTDDLYVRSVDGGRPILLATFAAPFTSLHARGFAAPTADRMAILSVNDSSRTSAQLTIVGLDGEVVTVAGHDFDYLSNLAWSSDGARLAATWSQPAAEGGTSSVDVVEVSAATGVSQLAARFENVFQAVPVGYSIDGGRLFVVTIDESGSALWAVREGKPQRVATLSTGRTGGWSLSPDGSRLAYVDIVPAGDRRYAGRTLVIATGAVTESSATGDELGPAWMPGAQMPVFGGPGGSIRLNPPSPEGAYVVPASWAPDGTMLVATIFSASSDRTSSPEASVELVTGTTRMPLAEDPAAQFVGWVRNIE